MKTAKRLYIVDKIRRTLLAAKCALNDDLFVEEIMRVDNVSLRGARACLKMAKGGKDGNGNKQEAIRTNQRRLGQSN